MNTLHTLAEIEEHLAIHPLSLLYAAAPDCGICHAIAPRLEAALADWPQIVAARADVSALPELAGRFHVLTVPVIILFADGREVWRAAKFIYQDELVKTLGLWASQYGQPGRPKKPSE